MFDSLKKIMSIKIKERKNKQPLPYDELEAEFIGYKKTFINRAKYIFEYDKAVKCYMEMEADNEIFFKVQLQPDNLTKNHKRKGNILTYEWSDFYFEQKGKGCSKQEIKQFLKKQGYKIKKNK